MLKNLFNCSNCARGYILWNTYFIRFSYNIDDFQWEFLTLPWLLLLILSEKKCIICYQICVYVKTNFSILHLIMSLSAHWFHNYYRSNFNYFLNISKTCFLITFLMKIYNWLVFAYHFPLHILLFFKENSMECAKALALQGKAKYIYI